MYKSLALARLYCLPYTRVQIRLTVKKCTGQRKKGSKPAPFFVVYQCRVNLQGVFQGGNHPAEKQGVIKYGSRTALPGNLVVNNGWGKTTTQSRKYRQSTAKTRSRSVPAADEAIIIHSVLKLTVCPLLSSYSSLNSPPFNLHPKFRITRSFFVYPKKKREHLCFTFMAFSDPPFCWNWVLTILRKKALFLFILLENFGAESYNGTECVYEGSHR